MELPLLTRQISSNVVLQTYGDCVAHTITRVVVKAFRTQYPVFFNVENSTTKCNNLYLHINRFFL
jgi:hypothetical protein